MKYRLTNPVGFPGFMLCCVLLLGGSVQEAKAGFLGYYVFTNFTLSNHGGHFANGFASSPDSNTVILTGPNSGSALNEWTDLTIASGWNGLLEFDYSFNTINLIPQNEFAGYLVNGLFTQLADTSGTSGNVSVPVLAGEQIGFRVGAVESQGEPGVLTITNFSAPVPEPGTVELMLVGAATALLTRIWRKAKVPNRSLF